MPRCKNGKCRNPIEVKENGRPSRFCSPACKQAAYRRRASQSALFSSKSDEWPTDPKVFEKYNAEYGPFTLDPCATAENAKCPQFFTRGDDGLSQRWTGRVWMNPPYGRTIGLWMKKAYESVRDGDAEIVVCLVPN